MPLIWTPLPDTPLIVSQEHETHLSTLIEVASDGQTPLPQTLLWSMPDGRPQHMRIHTTSTTLLLEIDDWVGLFPIEINTMQDAEPVQVSVQFTQWGDVPAEQSDVYAFIPDAHNVKHFRLIVEAYSAANQHIETATYTVTVYANYDIGKSALKQAIKTRKDA